MKYLEYGTNWQLEAVVLVPLGRDLAEATNAWDEMMEQERTEGMGEVCGGEDARGVSDVRSFLLFLFLVSLFYSFSSFTW